MSLAAKGLLTVALVTIGILGSVSTINYIVDPMCYFHCDKIDLERHTINHFYEIAQKIASHPNTEIIIVGSSRGQATSPLWLEKKTGLKALNLSVGGAEILAKTAFINIALEKDKIKKVIWFADYFELIPESVDAKIDSPVLLSHIDTESRPKLFSSKIKRYQELIDHNTLEASYYSIRNPDANTLDQGSGTKLDYKKCQDPNYRGIKTPERLQKEIGASYDNYTRVVFKPPQTEELWNQMVSTLEKLSQKNIETLFIIPPYNPLFNKELAQEYPRVVEMHKKWVAKLLTLKIPHVRIINFFDGLPHDDGSPRYWDDGVHFSCWGTLEMLNRVL